MDETSYQTKKRALEEQYRAQKQARTAALESQLKPYEAKLTQLDKTREQSNRAAYVRAQQRDAQLPESNAARGVNGGEAMSGRRRIAADYRDDVARNMQSYRDGAAQVRQTMAGLREKSAARAEQADAEYYSKLTALAEELRAAREKAARQAAEAAAREAERQRAVAEKQAAAAQRAAEKQAAAARRTAEKQAAAQKTAKQQSKAAKPASRTGTQENHPGVRRYSVPGVGGTETITQVGNRLIANAVSFDGSGTMWITVDGKQMSQEAVQRGLRAGTIRTGAGPMGAMRYEAAPRTASQSGGLTRRG